MEHADARELLELAAVEPGGLDRLSAGDTLTAAALAGHLAGCQECAALLVRLRRDASIVAEAVRMTPPADLRERTLAYVAAVGRPRGDGIPAVAAIPSSPAERPRIGATSPPLRWVAALAAVVVLAVAGTGLFLVTQKDAEIARQAAAIQRQASAIAGLNRVTTWGLRVTAQPDARRVALTGVGTDYEGSILYSPSSGELVIVAEGLREPPAGKEFRCWLEVDGRREPIGRMFFGGDLAFWAGPIENRSDLGAASRFGVTLEDAGGTSVEGEPVLKGDL